MFKRWHSIENHYQQKNIDHYLWLYPELANETYIITEKLHGANFQWYFEPGQPVRAGSRNRFIGESFQGVNVQQLYNTHKGLIDSIQYQVDTTSLSLRLFGELVGVQKGVDYGELKQVLYFGVMVDDVLKSFEYLGELFAGVEDLLVPLVVKVQGIQDVIDFDTEFDSKLIGKSDNICEGIVAQPFGKVYFDHGSPFLLKKKNEKFMEKAKAPKVVIVDTVVTRLNTEFRRYITDTRLQSVFSKEGEIEKPQQIGSYIKLILTDAKEDFLKDNDVSGLDAAQLKQVYNVGGQIAHMLKTYL